MAFLPAIGVAIAGFLGTTGVVATTAAAASLVGAGMMGASLLSGPKIPGQAQGTGAKIAAPNPAASLVDAQAQADAKRRESLLSGGLINPTGGRGSLLAADQTTKKTLLGS